MGSSPGIGLSWGERFWGHVDSAADIDLNQLLEKLAPDAQILVKGSNRVFWVHGFVEQLRRKLLEGSIVGDTGGNLVEDVSGATPGILVDVYILIAKHAIIQG